MAGIEDHVTCSICMDLYNDPLALPCMHSFCKHCIQGLFSSELVFKCPECRVEVNLGPRGAENLPRNFQLAGIVESYKREHDKSSRSNANEYSSRPFCTQHKMTCEILCTTCAKPMCSNCIVSERHPKRHKLKLLNKNKTYSETGETQQGTKCTDHDMMFSLFCNDCEILVCLKCVTKGHGGHSFASVSDTYEYNLEILKTSLPELDSRTRLLKATQNTCRMLARKTQEDAQKKRQELITYFCRLRDALDKKESQMKSELDRRENDIVQTYMTKADDVRRKEKLVCDVTDDVKRLVTENKIVLLKQFKNKATRINDLLTDEHTDAPPHQTGVSDVTLVTCAFEKELNTIQWRWPDAESRPLRKAPPVPAPRDRKRSSLTSKLRAPPSPTQMVIKPGTPVTRGKHWEDGYTDGGPGHVGTVTAVEMDPSYINSATCTVKWPNGKTGQYTFRPPSIEQISLI